MRALAIASCLFAATLLLACKDETTSSSSPISLDTLIINGTVYDGRDRPPRQVAVGIAGDRIAFIGDHNSVNIEALRTIDASGKYVTPGFIDPHTHALDDLLSDDSRHNTNYLTQGVTTVFVGNDGGGRPDVALLGTQLEENGIGTNVAFFVGHGAIRLAAMGRKNRAPSIAEQQAMIDMVSNAMREGAFGLSSGLYYSPGSYAKTEEVIALAKAAAQFGGVYESHIRDESSYNIGFVEAVKEALHIGEAANIPVHIAHIKALGVDVWGQSAKAVDLINAARKKGQRITADQYPWNASGTHLRNALVPRWMLADSFQRYQERLRDPELETELRTALANNIRRRGGADALLLVTGSNPDYYGKTLAQIAKDTGQSDVDAALDVLKSGKARVISFNMTEQDIETFMTQPWVVTSSDGNNRHPRKYASFPRKYTQYVKEKAVLSFESFVHRSSGLTADIFGIEKRGYIEPGYYADIAIIDPSTYSPRADYEHWNTLSTGIGTLLVNGEFAIDNGEVQPQTLAGRVLRHRQAINTKTD